MATWINVRPARNVRSTWPLWTNNAFNDPFFNEAFNWAFGTPRPNGSTKPAEATYNFRLNVAQDETNYYIYAVLPGVNSEKLEISALKNRLTIAGEIAGEVYGAQTVAPEGENKEQPQFKWLHRELPLTTVKFHRELELPTDINTEAVEATYENGILRLVVPQAAQARAQRISVSAAPANPQLTGQN